MNFFKVATGRNDKCVDFNLFGTVSEIFLFLRIPYHIFIIYEFLLTFFLFCIVFYKIYNILVLIQFALYYQKRVKK